MEMKIAHKKKTLERRSQRGPYRGEAIKTDFVVGGMAQARERGTLRFLKSHWKGKKPGIEIEGGSEEQANVLQLVRVHPLKGRALKNPPQPCEDLAEKKYRGQLNQRYNHKRIERSYLQKKTKTKLTQGESTEKGK